ncbi:MAG: hypothetical protein GXP53_06535 [Deltaproteobacteria bacterium]|nr:hypothetical protein [Deltaproteobacteria bacterium]
MTQGGKTVNGFRFMPKSLKAMLSNSIPEEEFSGHIPWTPMKTACKDTTFALITSAGINMKTEPEFNMAREKKEPLWGDPTYRKIPKTATTGDINTNHLHVNTKYIQSDMNVILPLARFKEFEQEAIIGELAPTHYSFYGFQLDAKFLVDETMPEIIKNMKSENVGAVFLTPT